MVCSHFFTRVQQERHARLTKMHVSVNFLTSESLRAFVETQEQTPLPWVQLKLRNQAEDEKQPDALYRLVRACPSVLEELDVYTQRPATGLDLVAMCQAIASRSRLGLQTVKLASQGGSLRLPSQQVMEDMANACPIMQSIDLEGDQIYGNVDMLDQFWIRHWPRLRNIRLSTPTTYVFGSATNGLRFSGQWSRLDAWIKRSKRLLTIFGPDLFNVLAGGTPTA